MASTSTPEFDVGDKIRLALAFTVAGTPTNPTAITVKVKRPDKTIDGPFTLTTPDSAGNYHYDYDLTGKPSGRYHWRGEGTGTAQAAAEMAFVVKRTEF